MTKAEKAREAVEARLRKHLRDRAKKREAVDADREAYERRLREPWPLIKPLAQQKLS